MQPLFIPPTHGHCSGCKISVWGSSHLCSRTVFESICHLFFPMLPRKERKQKDPANSGDSAARSQSLHSTVDDKLYDNVDTSKLYEVVLKILLIEYMCEARFYQPICVDEPEIDRKSRFSKLEDCLLPPNLMNDLKTKLNSLAMNSTTTYDDLTRRLLLRFYGEMLDPQFAGGIKRANSVDILVMKFVSSANKEIVKVGLIPPEEVSSAVFKQAELFLNIIISLVQKDRNSEALVAKLNEHKVALRPKKNEILPTLVAQNAKYPQPSFKVSDMDQAYILLLTKLFGADTGKIQQDVTRLKAFVTQKSLHKDVDQLLFYLNKNLGKFSQNQFSTPEAYTQWKERETLACELIKKKYTIPPAMRLLPAPALPSGEEFYVVPPSLLTQAYFVVLVSFCFLNSKNEAAGVFDPAGDEVLLFSNKSRDLLLLCARFWRVDYPSRAVGLYSAAHLAGILTDPLFAHDPKELGPIDLTVTTSVLQTCKRLVEDGKLDWDEKDLWCLRDQEEWVRNLGYTYSEVFYSIKDCLSAIMSKTVKPKFGPLLMFLGDYVESDSLFPQLAETGVVSKWERKLSRALLRTSENLYAELLSALPRDDTLSIIHILDISDNLVDNIKSLQKRYKNPLLGYLNVSKTFAAVITGMFASDAKNILKHIVAYVKARGQFLNYGDALEAYKSLCEIRSIHQQVSPNSTFKFDLEKFFFPYLESWVSESSEKIRSFVQKAIEEDLFEPIDIDSDDKKYSSSVHDVFSLIKNYLSILKALDWQDSYQLARVYTSLMKSISGCALLYASEMTDMVMKDLNDELERQRSDVPVPSGWFAEVKSIVNNIHSNSDKLEVEAVNFTPITCIGLNNISAMMHQLTKLEDLLDPEGVSAIVAKQDPKAGHYYTSHIFSIRVVKAENLGSTGDNLNIRPYLTLIDTLARKTIAKTRTLDTENPEWDEEFEITLPANSSVTLSATVWEEKFGAHSVCGRALIQLDPRKFKHDGIPQEIFLDLDPQGRVLVEVAVESEREDAIFAMGRAHRALKRSQQRVTKLIVAKFSKFIKHCLSRNTLKSVCGHSGNIRPTQHQMDEAMMPLYNYLNMNLLVLAQYLSKELLLKVMLEAWFVVVACADELLLPKLTSARVLRHTQIGSKLKTNGSGINLKTGVWQSAMSSAMANVTSSMNYLGFGKTLTNNEIETVISWLNFLCFDFFYNEGNGPPVHDLKNEQYQSLLLIPVYYDRESSFLELEVERLSPAYLLMLRDKNNVYISNRPDGNAATLRSRAGSIARSLTIRANATAKARARAAKEAKEMLSDPLAAQTSAENIILRLLLIKDEKSYVAKRVEQRERLAHTIATERLARAAAEGSLFR